MIIKKKEMIEFSAEELRCFEMTITLMENIADHGQDPNLIKNAESAWKALANIYDVHLEENE